MTNTNEPNTVAPILTATIQLYGILKDFSQSERARIVAAVNTLLQDNGPTRMSTATRDTIDRRYEDAMRATKDC